MLKRKVQKTFIRIAGITVELKSAQPAEKELKCRFRYEHFMLKKNPKKAEISLDLKIIPLYQRFKQKPWFEARRDLPKPGWLHLEECRELERDSRLDKQAEKYLGPELDWRIGEVGEEILIEGGSSSRYQLMIDKQLSRGKVYIISSGNQWKITDIIYGPLQVLIIYYLSKYKKGLLFHSCGIKERKRGYLFAGLTGAGKSTTSRIWDKLDSVGVLNDDRIIIRKDKQGFIMYPTPWHGDYSKYLKKPLNKARLSKMFYIYHRKDNFVEKLSQAENFNLFYQTLFIPFWSKRSLDFIAGFLLDMLSEIPAYKFGFKNDNRIISCTRGL